MTKFLGKIYKLFGFLSMVIGLGLVLSPILLTERLELEEVIAYKNNDTLLTAPALYKNNIETKEDTPPINPKLPKGHWLNIPKIGVYTQILESKNPQIALRKGVWRAYDFATPLSHRPNYPIILAAHRFGYVTWSAEYRRKNSFANLPRLEPGDKIYIYWDQREFVYQVYAKKVNEKIDDYSADLILYTCTGFNTPTRVFVYARLVK